MSNAKQNKQRKSNRGDGNRGGGNDGGGQNGRGGDKSRNSNNNNNRRRKGPRKKKVDPRVFWGDAEQLAQVPDVKATITTDPSAVVLSIGRPPLSGQQNAAEHYFVAVYDRAVNLAAALAAAGNLIEPEDLNGDRDS